MDTPRRYATLLLITASRDTAAQFAALLPEERFAPEFSVCTALRLFFTIMLMMYSSLIFPKKHSSYWRSSSRH